MLTDTIKHFNKFLKYSVVATFLRGNTKFGLDISRPRVVSLEGIPMEQITSNFFQRNVGAIFLTIRHLNKDSD